MRRLRCEGSGLIAHRLVAIGLVAATTTAAVGTAVWLRRLRGRGVGVAILALAVLAVLGVYADA